MSDMPPPQSGPQPARNPKADAKAAAAYAKASRPWYKKKRYWLLALILIIIIVVVASGGGGDTDGTDGTDGESGDQSTSKPVKVDAGKILKEFEENEAAADGKYDGKMLQVSGKVEKVDTEFFDEDEYVVRVSDGSQFAILTVNCNDLSSDEVSSLKKGDDITVVGEFDDGGDLGVEIKDCKIV